MDSYALEKDLMVASWWDNPGQQADDTPVVRHAPDNDNYHIPDYDQLTKMRGSKVGRFAIIPAANHDGTSRGFDATVAGPVHVDPDAPDGGVVFDPSTVSKRDINQAVSQSYYPHQVFYQLGTPAPVLGFGKGRRAFYDAQAQPGFDTPRVNERLPSNAYITPKAAEDGRQLDAPQVVADGYGGGPASYQPAFQAQEEHPVNPPRNPPLLGAPSPQSMPAPAPQPQGYPPPGMQQPMQPMQQPMQQPQYQAYPPQYPQYPPPQPDPNVQAMMQAMVGMQQQIGALIQQQTAPPQTTTGLSRSPLPSGPPPGLATVPAELRSRPRTRVGQSPYPGQEEFEDEAARPIRKQVTRNKQQDIVDERDEEEEETPRQPPRRARRNPNSLVEQDQLERQQTVEEYEEAQDRDRPRRGIIAGFETLNIPWVTGPVANKAKKQVFFEIEGAGKHSARYHDVIESEHCVALVYDTRYEDGTQYLPPDLQEQQIKLHYPDKKKTFTVSSMGFSFPFGVFDMIVLVKHATEGLDYGDDS